MKPALFCLLLSGLACHYVLAQTSETWLDQGNEKRFHGDQDGAIAIYTRVIQADPANAAAYTMRGFSYLDKNDYPTAYNDFAKAVALSPLDAIYHDNLANVLAKLNRDDEAMKEYNASLDLDPDDITTLINRGKLREKLADYPGAIADFTKAASIIPAYASVYNIEGWAIDQPASIQKLLGDAKQQAKDYPGAIAAYTLAIEETPKFPQAYEGRAAAKRSLGDVSGAAQDEAEAGKIRADPDKTPTVAAPSLLKGFLSVLAGGNYEIHFGIMETDKAGNTALSKETTVIPRKYHNTGFEFGYEVIPSNQNSYTEQYILHLPAPPTVVEGDLAQGQAGPSTVTLSSQRQYIPPGPDIETLWFDPGDPIGNYSVDILINGKLLKTVKFTVTDNSRG